MCVCVCPEKNLTSFSLLFLFQKKKKQPANEVDLKEHFIASMVLHSVGDAIGYNNLKWEEQMDGKKKQLPVPVYYY